MAEEVVQRMAAEAGRLLAGGTPPKEVFTRLCLAGDDLAMESAVAVAMAVGGVPRVEADLRLIAVPGLWSLDPDALSPKELARQAAELFESDGMFSAPVEYRGDQHTASELIDSAFREMFPMPPYLAGRYLRAVHLGRLHDALVVVSRPERGTSGVDTLEYWRRLVDAAELLGPDGDDEYVEAVRRCRARVAVLKQD